MNIHILRASVGRVPTAPREPRLAKRFPIATLIASMSLMVGVAGCGEERTGRAESGQQKSGSASGAPSPRASSGSASNGAEPDPRAVGIDTVKWPEDRKGGKRVFDRMPDQLAGMRGQHLASGVHYGPNDGVTAFVMSTDNEIKDPKAVLASMFGLGAVCNKDTYVGTAPYLGGPKSQWGVPGIASEGASGADDNLWWFSCNFKAPESRIYDGHAIGWVSGDLAWLVTSPDKNTSKTTVAAMKSK